MALKRKIGSLCRALLLAASVTALTVAVASPQDLADLNRQILENPGDVSLNLRYAHAAGFYVAPNVEWVPQGYDVDNAKTVTLNPPVAEVWPSHTRCFDVSPKNTTDYTLTIADRAGKTASETVHLEVR